MRSGDNGDKEDECPFFGGQSLEEEGLTPDIPKTRRSHGLEEALWVERHPPQPPTLMVRNFLLISSENQQPPRERMPGDSSFGGNQPGGLKGQPANLTAYCLLPDGTLIPS